MFGANKGNMVGRLIEQFESLSSKRKDLNTKSSFHSYIKPIPSSSSVNVKKPSMKNDIEDSLKNIHNVLEELSVNNKQENDPEEKTIENLSKESDKTLSSAYEVKSEQNCDYPRSHTISSDNFGTIPFEEEEERSDDGYCYITEQCEDIYEKNFISNLENDEIKNCEDPIYENVNSNKCRSFDIPRRDIPLDDQVYDTIWRSQRKRCYTEVSDAESMDSFLEQDLEACISSNNGSIINISHAENKIDKSLDNKAALIINELITTEENYIFRLKLTKESYEDWLKPRIGEKDTFDIFNKWDCILEENKHLLIEIKNVQKDYDAIARKFIQHKNWFERYPVYSRYFKKSKQVYKKHEKIIKKREHEINDDYVLYELLLLPMNRLTKYEMLLCKLYKCIPSETIHSAWTLIQGFAGKCNDLMALDSIRNKPKYYNYQSTGKFLMRNNFRLLAPRKCQVVLFLFDKKILMTKRDNSKEDNYFFTEDIDIKDLMIKPERKPKIFSLIKFIKGSPKITYRLEANDEQTTQTWLETINPILWKQLYDLKKKSMREENIER